jgi:hypothetical protein
MSQQKQAADEGSGDDHPNSDAPILANELVGALSDNQLTRLGMREQLWGMKGGLIALIHIKSWRTVR